MTPPEAKIVATDVAWRVGYRWILKNISLTVGPTDVALLVGGNGSGKTSLLRVLAGLNRASKGTVRQSGGVGLVAHHSMLYDALTGRENLRFISRLGGGSSSTSIEAVLGQMGLREAADERLATYSRGMAQRLAIARALLDNPGVLLLDEPLTGLDEAATRTVLDLIETRRNAGYAVIVASHQLTDLTERATTVGFLGSGALKGWEAIDGRDGRAIMSRHRELTTNA